MFWLLLLVEELLSLLLANRPPTFLNSFSISLLCVLKVALLLARVWALLLMTPLLQLMVLRQRAAQSTIMPFLLKIAILSSTTTGLRRKTCEHAFKRL